MPQNMIKCNNCGSKDHKLLVIAKGNRGVDFISRHHKVVICKECGLVFLNPQHDETDYIRYYTDFNIRERVDINKKIKELEFNSSKSGRAQIKDFLLKNIHLSALGKPLKLLDVGCGKGIFLAHLRGSGFVLEGLEPNKFEAMFARKRFGFKIYNEALSPDILPPASYDIVTALAVIEHVVNPLKTLNILWGLLKPDGYILLSTPDYREMILSKGVSNYFKFVHTFYFTEVTLSSLMEQVGFKVIKIWHKEKILKPLFLFKKVPYTGGTLVVLGQKGQRKGTVPRKDNAVELINIFKRTRRRELIYSLLNKCLIYGRKIKIRF